MKNQYFGDLNDYRTYGLLRLLTGGEIKTAVCWMLTPDDGRGDGGHTEYLSLRKQWRHFDPQLFDRLRQAVQQRGRRHVSEIENSHILTSCRFLSDLVPDEEEARAAYFHRLEKLAQGNDLIFFDPDNGIEVKSKPAGGKDSSKYLYWEEIQHFWNAGHSLLIYQHLPRVPRAPFIEGKARELIERTGAPEVFSFETSHVVFLLLSQTRHRDFFRARWELVAERWGSQLRVACHARRPTGQAC